MLHPLFVAFYSVVVVVFVLTILWMIMAWSLMWLTDLHDAIFGPSSDENHGAAGTTPPPAGRPKRD